MVEIRVSGESVRRVLETALGDAGLAGRCAVVEGGVEVCALAGSVRFERPVRLGAVLDSLRRALQQADLGPPILHFGPFTLDRAQAVLTDDNGQDVRLTEKETHILALLHSADGRALGRAELLNAVWGYGAEIETHTLETHIYRLRQKIEADAAAPVFLLTDDDGYKLKKRL